MAEAPKAKDVATLGVISIVKAMKCSPTSA